jgi:hypothetical protein
MFPAFDALSNYNQILRQIFVADRQEDITPLASVNYPPLEF